MQVRQQCRHLRIVKSTRKCGHHAFARQHYLSNLRVSCRSAAGQRRLVEEPMEIGRNFLESEVVVFMAMRASHLVEVLPFHLL